MQHIQFDGVNTWSEGVILCEGVYDVQRDGQYGFGCVRAVCID